LGTRTLGISKPSLNNSKVFKNAILDHIRDTPSSKAVAKRISMKVPKTASKFQTSVRKIVVSLQFNNVCKTENGNCVPREYFSAKGASSIQDLT
jgi:hypothetical protein